MTSTPSSIPATGTAPTPSVPADVNETETAPGPEISKEDRQKAVTEEYSKATTWLREEYRDAFHGRMKSALADRGIDWSPQPTKQEKALAEIQRLATEAGVTVQVTA